MKKYWKFFVGGLLVLLVAGFGIKKMRSPHQQVPASTSQTVKLPQAVVPSAVTTTVNSASVTVNPSVVTSAANPAPVTVEQATNLSPATGTIAVTVAPNPSTSAANPETLSCPDREQLKQLARDILDILKRLGESCTSTSKTERRADATNQHSHTSQGTHRRSRPVLKGPHPMPAESDSPPKASRSAGVSSEGLRPAPAENVSPVGKPVTFPKTKGSEPKSEAKAIAPPAPSYPPTANPAKLRTAGLNALVGFALRDFQVKINAILGSFFERRPFNPQKPVYLAGDWNGWLSAGEKAASDNDRLVLKPDGYFTSLVERKDLGGKRFTIVQFDDDGKILWAQYEHLKGHVGVHDNGDGTFCLRIPIEGEMLSQK